ncbi:GIY-YIG nuclease family protein [Opitutus terrae]|uniref:GIY-YIG nuclease family protein n=1 Tax=Opitutus terrae TaxID=107709 RepID=UPI00130519D0
MFSVYILRGGSGRHYIGMTGNFGRRLAEHRRGHTPTTARLGGDLQVAARCEFPDRATAAMMERLLKRWKNPESGRAPQPTRSVRTVEQPRRVGVGRRFNPGPWHQFQPS